MDRIQARVLEIAQRIPEYVGYQAKERRREEDKLIRRQLALKYEEQRTRLARIARQAPLDQIVSIENLDQKLRRLVARLNTAPTGYAGWFDAGQIVENNIEQLTQFDAGLTEGVDSLKASFEQLASAVKSKRSAEDAVEQCAVLIDQLNTQFDQREQFLAMGIKASLPAATSPIPQSPLNALRDRVVAPSEVLALTNLKRGDALSLRGSDFLVAGKITYTNPSGTFWAYMLQNGLVTNWLRVGPDNEVSLVSLISLPVSFPLPDQLTYESKAFSRDINGTASVSVEGPSGSQRGTVTFARYAETNGEARIWIEDLNELRTAAGSVIDPAEIKVYRK